MVYGAQVNATAAAGVWTRITGTLATQQKEELYKLISNICIFEVTARPPL